MMHKPIYLKNLSLSFSHKICFSEFSAHIEYGSRIALIAGKTVLQTREHVIQVLRAYPGALIVISHDQRFSEGNWRA